VWHPLGQEMPRMALGERDQKVQALPPERAQESLTRALA
jgi:hypothetical protein